MAFVCKDTGESAKTYPQYLKTRHWQELRKAIVLKNGNKCEYCKATTTKIHIHHKNYRRVGEELFTDLSVLCPDCHLLVHEKLKKKAASRKKRNRKTEVHFWTGEIREETKVSLCFGRRKKISRRLKRLILSDDKSAVTCPICIKKLDRMEAKTASRLLRYQRQSNQPNIQY